MSTNLSKLADELKPYFVPWVRKIAQGGGGAAGTGGTPDMLAHVLASTSALGTFHTVAGLTAGQVLRATSATNAAFGQLLHSQLGGIGANDHHNQARQAATFQRRGNDVSPVCLENLPMQLDLAQCANQQQLGSFHCGYINQHIVCHFVSSLMR